MESLTRSEIQSKEAEKLRPVMSYFFKGADKDQKLDETIRLLFEHFGTLQRILHATAIELRSIDNVSDQLACFIVEAGAIIDTIDNQSNKVICINDTISVAKHARRYFNAMDRECLIAIALRSNKSIIQTEMLFRGTIDTVSTYPREIIRFAQKNNTRFIILAHNHPGGTCNPSREDVTSTLQLQNTLKKLGITLQDHVVVGLDGAYSILNKRMYSLSEIKMR